MTPDLSPSPTRYRESEPDRIRRILGNLPDPVQDALRDVAEKAPAVQEFVVGDPHLAIQRVIGRVRDALRPGQS